MTKLLFEIVTASGKEWQIKSSAGFQKDMGIMYLHKTKQH